MAFLFPLLLISSKDRQDKTDALTLAKDYSFDDCGFDLLMPTWRATLSLPVFGVID